MVHAVASCRIGIDPPAAVGSPGPGVRRTQETTSVILNYIPEPARAAGLEVLMKGAGKLTRFIPIPQPTLLVGPGSSARLGQAARRG